jgi:SAM-dependent methyltransferase
MSLPPEFRPTNNDPSVGTPNFNRLAGPYRWMERLTFGPCLAWCRFAFLARAASCRHALVLGDGDGRFAARLLRANPHIHIDAVDASSSMLRALNENAGPHAARVRTHLADARQWHPAAGSPYDLVVTHFFLDCLTTDEIQSVATRLRSTLSPTALWIVSEFAIPPNWYGRLVARPLIALLYRACPHTSRPPHRAPLRRLHSHRAPSPPGRPAGQRTLGRQALQFAVTAPHTGFGVPENVTNVLTSNPQELTRPAFNPPHPSL